VGKNLGTAVESYNDAVGTLESRVLVSARKFRELEATSTEIEIAEVSPLDKTARGLQAPELLALPGSESPALAAPPQKPPGLD
jgi:DNA recombination protein RmuC